MIRWHSREWEVCREEEYRGCYPGRAFIETLILWIVHSRPLHGYEIRKRIEQVTTGSYVPKPGAIYTILRRMEEKGLLVSQWERGARGRDRRVYSITKKGENLLKARLRALKARIKLLEQMVSYYDDVFLENEGNV